MSTTGGKIEYGLNPVALAERRYQLSAEYSQLSERLAAILETKPKIWLSIRENEKSDMACERKWQGTESGIEEMKLRLLLKAKEKEMSGIRTYLDVLSAEARNQF